jgi:membrane protein implicated in regulation of membrane protease activity
MKPGPGDGSAEEVAVALQDSPTYEEYRRRRTALGGAAFLTMTSLGLSLPDATVALSIVACLCAAGALWLLVWALRDVRGEEEVSEELRQERKLGILVVVLGVNALAQIPAMRPALEIVFLALLAGAIPLLYSAAIRRVRRALLASEEEPPALE